MTVKELPTIRWPEDWRNVPLWAMFDRVKDVGHPDEEMLSVYREYGVIKKSSRDDNTNQTAENRNIYQLIDKGWLVVNRMKAWQGSVGISPVRGIVSGHYICFRPRHGEDPRFLDWLLRSDVYRTEYARMSRGVRPGQIEIDNDELHGLRIALPLLEEQRRIADFLDREIARIDALIAAKRRMVGLLNERWSVIRRHVTQAGGSSEWSSRVQLRRVARLQAGAAFPHERQGDADGTIPYVKVGDLSNVDEHDQLQSASNRVTPQVAVALRSPVLPSGTIVLPKIGAALLTNRRAVLSEPSCLDQNVMGISVETGNPRFVYYCLSCIDLGELSTPGPVPLLNEDAALSVRIPWPSMDEQDRIVGDLDRQRERIQDPTTMLARQIALLQERRQTLITAAVNGQLNIPEAA